MSNKFSVNGIFAVLTALCLGACGADVTPFQEVDGGDTDSGSKNLADPCEKMDVMFVIDDSGSMAEEQTNLTLAFSQFADLLSTYENSADEQLDFRIAVTTTGRDVTYNALPDFPGLPKIVLNEKGDNGAFRKSQCGLAQPWVDRADPSLKSKFDCMAQVGTNGPGIEMPLLTTELALTSRRADGTNVGFLRDDALLSLIILTDEDDCSRTDNGFDGVDFSGDCSTNPAYVPVQHYVDVLDTIKGDRSRWATAVIAGPNDCTSAFGDAEEAKRLKQFVSLTGQNAIFSSICSGDLTTPLRDALDTFTEGCEKIQID